MKKAFYIPLSLLVSVLYLLSIGCDNNNGLFGHSKTKKEAEENGSTVTEYLPDKNSFNLLDGTEMKIDTAWTEVSFTYRNGKRIIDSTYGYHLSIPFKKEKAGTFTFSFSLADTTNRVFTDGMGEDLAPLCPRKLFDKMQVLLEQKNTDTSKGWTQPIITDTITFTRLK